VLYKATLFAQFCANVLFVLILEIILEYKLEMLHNSRAINPLLLVAMSSILYNWIL